MRSNTLHCISKLPKEKSKTLNNVNNIDNFNQISHYCKIFILIDFSFSELISIFL